jgi:hypothetical protein
MGCYKNAWFKKKIAFIYALVEKKNLARCLLKTKWLMKRQLGKGSWAKAAGQRQLGKGSWAKAAGQRQQF